MKKISNSILLAGIIFFLVGCGAGNAANDPEKDAKIQKQVAELKEQVAKLKDAQDGVVREKIEAKKEVKVEEKIEVENKNLITIDSPKDKDNITKEPVIFNGTISAEATKIVVTSSADGEAYALQSFKQGSTKFSYKAGLKFKNLKVGANTFDFTATFKDGSTKTTKLIINFSK